MPSGPSGLRFKGDDVEGSRKRRRLSPEEPQTRTSSSGKTRRDEYSFVFDEAAYDDDSDQRPARLDAEEAFNERLFEAMREDEGLDAIEGFYSSTSHVPGRWRNDRGSSYSTDGPNGIDALDEEAYAEHIRTGMYRRTHAEEIRRQEQAEKDRKERDARLKAERKAAEKAERERLKREEREARRYEAESAKTRRANYDAAWTRLISLPADHKLRSSDFVWPVGIGEPLDAKHITRFLLGHLGPDDDDRVRRKALRAPLLAYHPDRFMRLVERVPSNEQEAVRQSGLRVSQLLNDILAGV